MSDATASLSSIATDSWMPGPTPGHLGETDLNARVDQLEAENVSLSKTLELLCTLDQTSRLSVAGSLLLDEILNDVGGTGGWLIWRGESGRYRVASSRGETSTSKVDLPILLAAAAEVAIGGASIVLSREDGSSPPASRCCQRMHGRLDTTNFVGIPISTPQDGNSPSVAVLILTDVKAYGIVKFCEAAGPLIAQKLSLIVERERSSGLVLKNKLGVLWRSGGFRLLALIFMLLGMLMCVPIPHRIHAKCVLQPIERRFVAAPTDAPLEWVSVRPGDTVEAGEKIARVDGQRLQFELASAKTELQHAEENFRNALIERDQFAKRLAGLEVKRLESRVDLLQYVSSQLTLRSPISGVVIAGDWKSSESVPLSKGETLFEIAPLERMLVEIQVAEDDLIFVSGKLPVEIRLDAKRGERLVSSVGLIHPRAEMVDRQNIFIAEADLDNVSEELRPGMTGWAVIEGGKHPIAWVWFHKPYTKLMSWLDL
ncbi:MAG: efflux RND transporter periplasmic adaptor subunit [Planctomycetota bacterium]